MEQLFIEMLMALEHVPVMFLGEYEDVAPAFALSSARIDDTIEFYDIKQIGKTDFYYMYRMPMYGGKLNPEDIEKNFIDILNGDFEGLVNDPSKFYTALGENNVFLDILNDIFLIKGRK